MASALRATLSWFAACFVGTCVGVACFEASGALAGQATASLNALAFGLGALFIGAAILTAPLSLVLVLLMRMSGIRRPWADSVGGAAVGATAAILPELLYHQHLIEAGALIPYAMAGGFAAGPLYWWLTGRPRPPY